MRLATACLLATLSALTFGGAGAFAASDSQSKSTGPEPKMDLTIYHIEGRRSERVVWLCEELGLPYKLEFKRGDVAGSMQTIREVSPLMPVAPTVKYNGKVLVESGAILEYLL